DLARALILSVVSGRATAHAIGFDGMTVHDPVADVEVMDVLLADIIAAEPGEVIPVVDLEFHLGHALATTAIPNAVAVPVGLQEDESAERAAVDLVDGLDELGRVTALEA